MEDFTNNELLEIKKFYTNKKETFANTLEPEYYSNRKYNGESFGYPQTSSWLSKNYKIIYGYEFASPYTEEEINTYEADLNTNLDPNLKLYLLKVSRELFVTGYPSIFELDTERSCLIPENKTMWNAGDCCIHGKYGCINNMENCTDDCPGIYDGMSQIGMRGCSFDDFIVVKGNHIGSIWNSDGDAVYKMDVTFKQYVHDGVERRNR
jgi:hypothetical protein